MTVQSWFGKCANGRRFSPLMALLLVGLVFYSFLLLKRIRHQQATVRHRRDLADDEDNVQQTSSNSANSILTLLNFKSEQQSSDEQSLEDRVGLYIITPTYPRPEQLAELTRLSQTLMHLKNAMWIVAEDSKKPTSQVVELLNRVQSALPNVYLQAPMPDVYRRTKDEYHLPKGVSNRNKGLEWILQNGVDNAVVYFADDDNTYDLRLFHEIRKTKRVSAFPVGLVSGSPVSTPIVQDGQFGGFYVGWEGNRKFPLDMAGFAFTVRHYRELSSIKKVSMPYIRGYEEDGFVKQLEVTRHDLEFLTTDKILVWHTKTTKTVFKPFKKISRNDYLNTNLGPLSAYWCMYLGSYKCADEMDTNDNNNNNNAHGKSSKQIGYKIV